MTQTITEALAEIATIDKRLPKKIDSLLPYVARPEVVKDPMEKEGGSEKYLAEQRQSFTDLLERKIVLRKKIAEANGSVELSIDGTTMSVADWLVWKRECYELTRSMLQKLLTQAQNARRQAQGQGVVMRPGDPAVQVDIVVNVDEQDLIEKAEALEEVFGRLDGLLSLKNATTVIE